VTEDRLREAVLYVCEKSRADTRFGKTKLNKLLWFADVAAFLELEKSITRTEYQKLEHGPAPRAMKPVLSTLIESGELREQVLPVVDFARVPLVPQRPANTALFSGRELELLDEKIKEHWGKNARNMRALSHEEIGWRAARMGETIPLETAFITDEPLTPKEKALANDLQNVPAYAR